MKKHIAVFFALPFLTAATFAQTAKSKISPRINEMIIATIIEAQENVYDYDGDGQINCLDYSCVFKLTWDKNFPGEKYRCCLVRNYQPDVMNHLFAQVQDENFRNIEIETWTDNPYHYLLTEIWPSDRYNPAFNRYGETERWLSEGNRSLKPKKKPKSGLQNHILLAHQALIFMITLHSARPTQDIFLWATRQAFFHRIPENPANPLSYTLKNSESKSPPKRLSAMVSDSRSLFLIIFLITRKKNPPIHGFWDLTGATV